MMKIICSLFIIFSFFIDCKSQSVWNKSNDKFSISMGKVDFTVDASKGGRIVSLSLDNIEMLNQNYPSCGSLLWPSPQSSWGWWPPIDAFTNEPFVAELQNNNTVLSLTSSIDKHSGFQMKKIIRCDKTDHSFEIKYVLINKTDSLKKIAPWEVSFVPINGLFFFPRASAFSYVQKKKGNPKELLPLIEDSVVWYKYSSNDHHKKLFRDGAEGWTAMVYKGILFLKKYPNIQVKDFAPEESEVEIYTASDHAEFELQGPLTSLKKNQSIEWTVKWFLKEIPVDIDTSAGSKALIDFARSVIHH